ncbi:MAG: GNAT family N-acetyltransferase [Candidatus Tectimicrobiota bacterium]
MASSPPLLTPRLRLVPFTAAHLTPRYVAWLNDPEVVRYSEQRHHRHTLHSCRMYWQALQETPHYFWAIETHQAEPGHIGNLTAYVDPVHAVADLGILLGARQVWGRGYGAEAWMASCNYLLGPAGLRKITAGTLAVHTAMLGVMRRAGMVEDGRRCRHMLWDGAEVDVVHMALFRDARR